MANKTDTIMSPGGKTEKYVYDPIKTANAVNMLTEDRIRLLTRHPFFGQLIVRLRLVDASAWLPTCAVDFENLYFNVSFLESLTTSERMFVLCHEVLHLAYNHLYRREFRNAKLWNCAADYVINGELSNSNIGKMPKVGLLDHKYDGMMSEEVYDLLEQEGNDGESGNEGFDIHLGSGEGDEGEDGDGQISEDENGNATSTGPAKQSADRQKEKSDEFRGAVMAAAQSTGAGNTPAGIQRLIKDLTEAKIDWREVIARTIISYHKTDYSWNRRSRAGLASGLILPGMTPEDTVKVCMLVDTSGSMTDDILRDVLSEINGICQQFSTFELTLASCDTQVYSYKKFTEANADDVMAWQMGGGGGTEMVAFSRFAAGDEPAADTGEYIDAPTVFDCLVCLTDGYIYGNGWIDDETAKDLIYIVHSNSDKNFKAPNGETYHYTKDGAERVS